MFEKFFEKYPQVEVVEKPTESQITSYDSVLPDPIRLLWKQFGWGEFMGGYMRLLNPQSFSEFSKKYISFEPLEHTPWAVSVYGDLFTYKSDGYLYFFNYRYSSFDIIGSEKNIDILFNYKFADEKYILDRFKSSSFQAAKDRLGLPGFDQCYGYFPLLALGGRESVDSLQIVDLQVHMELMAQASGPL
jgi:hypothetical protein